MSTNSSILCTIYIELVTNIAYLFHYFSRVITQPFKMCILHLVREHIRSSYRFLESQLQIAQLHSHIKVHVTDTAFMQYVIPSGIMKLHSNEF